jgi:hypothetical protein
MLRYSARRKLRAATSPSSLTSVTRERVTVLSRGAATAASTTAEAILIPQHTHTHTVKRQTHRRQSLDASAHESMAGCGTYSARASGDSLLPLFCSWRFSANACMSQFSPTRKICAIRP